MRYKKLTRALSMVLSVTILTTSIPYNAFAAEVNNPGATHTDKTSEQEYVYAYGDVDENGVIDLSDVLEMKNNQHKNNDKADFNADGVVNDKDIDLLRQYMVGADVSLAPPQENGVANTHTVKFIVGSNEYASTEVDDRGTLHNLPEPPVNESGVFVGWFVDDEPFYSDSAITSDMTVVAKFQDVKTPVDLVITSFSAQDVDPSYVLYVKNIGALSNVEDAISIEAMDGSVAPELEVTTNGDFYNISAIGGFTAGSAYQITISEGLQFYGKIDGGAMEPKLETVTTANITVERKEENKLEFNKDMGYLADTAAIKYYVDGNAYDYITSAPVSLGESGNGQTKGYFEINNPPYKVGQSLCIGQESSQPDIKNLNEETTAYVTITKIEGNKVYFETVTSENLDEIIFMPATIPFSVTSEDLIPTENGTILQSQYDKTAWDQIYPNENIEPEVGDFIVVYEGRFVELQEEDKAYYAKVTAVVDGVISFETTSKEAIADSMDMFQKQPVEQTEVLTETQKEQIVRDVTQQAKDTGFAEEAAYYLADMATQTDGFKNASGIRDFSAKDENGNDVDLRTLGVGKEFELTDDVSLTVEFSDSKTYFTDGVRLALMIEAEFEVEIDDENKIIIELSAAFEQEVAVDVSASVDADVVWYLFIPVIKEITCKASVDLKNFSAVSIDVRMYSKFEEKKTVDLSIFGEDFNAVYKKLKGFKDQYDEVVGKIEEIEGQIAEAKKWGEETATLIEALDNEFNKIPAQDGMDSKEWYEKINDAVGATNITSELKEMVGLTDGDEIDAGMKNLMDTYDEMLDQESDWITLCEKNIFETDILIVIVAIGIGVDFVIRANVNIALGTGFEYVVGKRYTFWFQVFSGKSGSSEMDLLDEKFQFYFYVMGAIGLRMGVKANICVGIISTKIASVGFSAEVGPYIKLWGYFIYEYSKMRPMGSDTWTEKETMLGALYLEFGLYFIMAFEAQAFNGLFEYEAELFNEEWALLSAGERKNVYTFAYEVLPDEGIRMNNTDDDISNGITTEIPKSYRTMTYMDLVEGDRVDQIYNSEKFKYTLSSPYFKMEQTNGDTLTVNVKPPQGVRYLECDLTITWTQDKLTFSNRPISVTIPLFWTTLSNSEFKQKVQASVEVRPEGHPNDNSIIWSKKMTMGTEFDLPSENEVLDLMEYDSYDYNGTNIRYDEVSGYDGTHQTENVTLQQDYIYNFDVDYRDYTLNVNGVTAGEKNSFGASYGESFDISSLANTGTDNDSTKEYTGYAGLEVVAKDPDPRYPANQDVTRAIDSSFAKELLSGANHYNAIYTDNAMEIEFVFEGVEGVEPIKEIVKKGEVPENGMEEARKKLVAKYPKAYIATITPSISNVNANTTYQVVCMNPAIPPIVSTLHYELNEGVLHEDTIQDQQIAEMTDMNAPNEPTKEGHKFVGWFEDEELTKEYIFHTMPSYDVTVYAKWEIEEYELNFDYQADSDQITGDETISVNKFFGDKVGELPSPVYKGYRFEGWYTEENGLGEEVTKDTVIKADTVLYADWTEKEEFHYSEFNFDTSITATYEPNKTYTLGFEVIDNSTADGDGTYSMSDSEFDVKYQRKQYPGEDPTSVAQNAGDYTIQISREEDDSFKEFYYGFDNNPKTGESLITINKASRTINADMANVWADTSKGIRTVTELNSNSYVGDGVVEYSISNFYLILPPNGTTEPTTWSQSRSFETVVSSIMNYDVFVRVAEGENYLETPYITIKDVEANSLSPYSVPSAILTRTSSGGEGGTDAHLEFSAYDALGNNLGSTGKFKANGYEQNDEESAGITIKSPWALERVKFYSYGGGYHEAWTCFNTEVKVGNMTTGRYQINSTIDQEQSMYYRDIDDGKYFSRIITNIEGWNNISSTINVSDTSAGDALVTWGNVSDQYTYYNMYQNYAPPKTKISMTEVPYFDGYYSQCLDVVAGQVAIDQAKLYRLMKQQNASSITLKVTLDFGNTAKSIFGAETSSVTKTITINADI